MTRCQQIKGDLDSERDLGWMHESESRASEKKESDKNQNHQKLKKKHKLDFKGMKR